MILMKKGHVTFNILSGLPSRNFLIIDERTKPAINNLLFLHIHLREKMTSSYEMNLFYNLIDKQGILKETVTI